MPNWIQLLDYITLWGRNNQYIQIHNTEAVLTSETSQRHCSPHYISIENRHMKPMLFLTFSLPTQGIRSNTRAIYILLAPLYLKLFAQLPIPGPQ